MARFEAKANAKIGSSTGSNFRVGVLSPCMYIEAFLDQYGKTALDIVVQQIMNDLVEHGDSKSNAHLNTWLNTLPTPTVRKQNRPKIKANRAA